MQYKIEPPRCRDAELKQEDLEKKKSNFFLSLFFSFVISAS